MTGQPPRKKGIIDPWRIVEPLHKPEPKPTELMPGQKIGLDQIDFDADLRVTQQCAFRCRSGSILVRSKLITNANDALCNVLRCLFQLLEQKGVAAELLPLGIALQYGNRVWNTRDVSVAAKLETREGYTPPSALYFLRQTHDDGMLRLIKFLNDASRRPGPAGADILKRWGIVLMMR